MTTSEAARQLAPMPKRIVCYAQVDGGPIVVVEPALPEQWPSGGTAGPTKTSESRDAPGARDTSRASKRHAPQVWRCVTGRPAVEAL